MYIKLEKWARHTINFEPAAIKVFLRLIRNDGPGLLVLQGGEPGIKPANKSLFLGMVQEFTDGASSEKTFLSSYYPDLWDLLEQLDSHHYYQCCDVKQILKRTMSEDEIYSTPLSVAVTYALAFEGKAHGFTPYRKMVILCDNIEKYMRFNKESNENYLRDLASKLDGQQEVTFLGATQLIWYEAESVLGSERLIPLGGD